MSAPTRCLREAQWVREARVCSRRSLCHSIGHEVHQ
jgi:hypothetical protein